MGKIAIYYPADVGFMGLFSSSVSKNVAIKLIGYKLNFPVVY
jgi:hypothetical protein